MVISLHLERQPRFLPGYLMIARDACQIPQRGNTPHLGENSLAPGAATAARLTGGLGRGLSSGKAILRSTRSSTSLDIDERVSNNNRFTS
jgi:hypothetical protein